MLPGYEIKNALVDFSPITNAIESNQQNALMRRRADVEDQRLGMDRERLDMAKAESAEQAQMRKVQRWGAIANTIDSMPDGPQKAAAIQQFHAGNPDLVAHAQKTGIDPAHPQFMRFVAAEAGKYDPMQRRQAEASIAASNASAALHNAQAGNVGRTSEINEYEYAKKGGYTGTFQDWQQTQANKNASQAITWGQNANGEWVPMQATRAGELVPSKLPAGVNAVPGDVLAYRKAAATEQGEAAGKARVNLPVVEAASQRINEAIDAVANHPNLSRMTGWTGNLPNVTPAARDAQAKIDQVQGKVFLQAFDALRGAGAITENESAGAKLAYSRLQETRVGTPEYKMALADVKKEMANLVQIARTKAAGGGPSVTGVQPQQRQQPPPSAPVRVTSPDEARRLPSGTPIILPDGSPGRVP